ncbi:hypothetical protein CHUAL_006428 [Chamberlinius hualienensis]
MTDENNQQYRGRGTILQSGEVAFRGQLRRPGANNECVINTTRSTLSPDAPEFVPRSASHWRPAGPRPSYVPEPSPNGAVGFESLDAVRTVIYELSVNPGRFDTLAEQLCNSLNASITDEATLNNVVDEIYEQSLIEPNLRYNGSRLCNYLSKNLMLAFDTQSFRNLLLNRCRVEFDKRDEYASSPETRKRLRDFAMLMGELFMNLEILKDGQPIKIQILAKTIPDLLDTLLKHSTTEDVKCVCLLLKFTGAALEDAISSSLSKLNDLFEVMKALTTQESFERRMKDMLTNVIQLRERNWGRGTPTQLMENLHLTNSVPSDEPVFYGPDGQPISNEEAQFLESDKYLYADNPEDDYSSGDYASHGAQYWSPGDGMDDEMVEDYEKFLNDIS